MIKQNKNQVAQDPESQQLIQPMVDEQKTGLISNFTSIDQVSPTGDKGAWIKAKFGMLLPSKKKIIAFFDAILVQIIMTLLVFVVLLLNDIVIQVGLKDKHRLSIDVILLICFAAFLIELMVNIFLRNAYDRLFIFLDLVGTLSILVDVSFIRDSIFPEEGKGTDVARAAIIASRAGRMARLFRMLRIMRALKFIPLLLRYQQGATNVKQKSGSPTKLSHKVLEQVSCQASLLILVSLVLSSQWGEVSTTDRSREVFASQLSQDYLSKTQLDSLVDQFVSLYVEDGDGQMPYNVTFGSYEWTQGETHPFMYNQERNRQQYRIEQDQGHNVTIWFDITELNLKRSTSDIILIHLVLVELLLFVLALNYTLHKNLVGPLERIFTLIQNHTTQIMSALHVDQQDEDLDETINIESSIEKMGKVLQHLDNVESKGQKQIQKALDSASADTNTKEWLRNMAGQEFERQRSNLGSKKMELGRSRKYRASADQPPQSGEDQEKPTDTPESVQLVLDTIKTLSLNVIRSYDYDVLAHDEDTLVAHVVFMFIDVGLIEPLEENNDLAQICNEDLLPINTFIKFVQQVQQNYHKNPYHCWFHCVDVTHGTYKILNLTRTKLQFKPLEILSLMLAALIHDMDHPGVTNAYLVSTKHRLALTYNDSSVLENRHVSCMFSLIKDNPDLDILRDLSQSEQKIVRKHIIGAVLHTDMVHHFQMVSQIEMVNEIHKEIIESAKDARDMSAVFQKDDDRQLLLNLTLHLSDISNPMKPFEICKKWSSRVLEEFFAQGDSERLHKLPVSPMCDRYTTSPNLSQINFIEFIVAPLIFQSSQLFPELSELLQNLVSNRERWGIQYLQELSEKEDQTAAEQEKQKERSRLAKFNAQYTTKRRQTINQLRSSQTNI